MRLRVRRSVFCSTDQNRGSAALISLKPGFGTGFFSFWGGVGFCALGGFSGFFFFFFGGAGTTVKAKGPTLTSTFNASCQDAFAPTGMHGTSASKPTKPEK